MKKLRDGLPQLPARVAALPVDPRGYPIPWFVANVDGKRDFRIADESKRVAAVKNHLCWICGQKLGQYLAFVIGPMCAVNRNTSEPPCHRECAEFAAQACPFLCLPKAEYRRANLPEGSTGQPHALPGNPGAVCIWITKSFKPYRVNDNGNPGWLIRLGDPVEALWYADGKVATRERIMQSFNERFCLIHKVAEEEGPAAVAQLSKMKEETMRLLPQ